MSRRSPGRRVLFRTTPITRALTLRRLRIAWLSIIVVFGATILLIHLYDQRVAEHARRERRERLKARSTP